MEIKIVVVEEDKEHVSENVWVSVAGTVADAGVVLTGTRERVVALVCVLGRLDRNSRQRLASSGFGGRARICLKAMAINSSGLPAVWRKSLWVRKLGLVDGQLAVGQSQGLLGHHARFCACNIRSRSRCRRSLRNSTSFSAAVRR